MAAQKLEDLNDVDRAKLEDEEKRKLRE